MKPTATQKYASLKGNNNAKKKNPKSYITHVRFTENDWLMIQKMAKSQGVTVTEYVRDCVTMWL